MKTDDLIDALSHDLQPTKAASLARRVIWALSAGAGGGLLLLIATLGLRPDFSSHFVAVLLKAGFSAALLAAALPVLLRLARPGMPLAWRLAALVGTTGTAIVAALIALAGEDPSQRMHAWTGGGIPWCLVAIPVLAVPTAVALTWLARSLAPTRLELTGAAIGAAAGGVGAIVYAMYCPVDSVAFVATWYAVAIGICAALGAIVGSRFLRW
ncbi:MAG: NrsF family protein [Caulobacterales bacterium]|jgi:hypothetical protein